MTGNVDYELVACSLWEAELAEFAALSFERSEISLVASTSAHNVPDARGQGGHCKLVG